MAVETRAAVLSSMGAARPYADSRPLAVQPVSLEPPGRGEVQVAIRAAGLCHSDLSVINGDRPGRVSDDQITLFDGTGVGLQDLAVASAAVDLAVERGIAIAVQI